MFVEPLCTRRGARFRRAVLASGCRGTFARVRCDQFGSFLGFAFWCGLWRCDVLLLFAMYVEVVKDGEVVAYNFAVVVQ